MGEHAKAKISMGILEKLLEGEKHKIEKFKQELSGIVPNVKEKTVCQGELHLFLVTNLNLKIINFAFIVNFVRF